MNPQRKKKDRRRIADVVPRPAREIKVENLDFEETADPEIVEQEPKIEPDVLDGEILDELEELTEQEDNITPSSHQAPASPKLTPPSPSSPAPQSAPTPPPAPAPQSTPAPAPLPAPLGPKERYQQEPPEPGFDVVIKTKGINGTITKYNFNKYCLLALPFFRPLLASTNEIDLTEYEEDVVLAVLIYLDPHCEPVLQFNPLSVEHSRRFITFARVVDISAKRLEPCIARICYDPEPADVTLFLSLGLYDSVGELLAGLKKHNRLAGQSSAWYLSILTNFKLSSKVRASVVTRFIQEGNKVDYATSAIIATSLGTLRKKIKTLYMAAGDQELTRAILLNLGTEASVEAIKASELLEAVTSIPAIARRLATKQNAEGESKEASGPAEHEVSSDDE